MVKSAKPTGPAVDPRLKAAKRLLRAKEAQVNLLPFTHMTMPDPVDPADSDRSRYIEAEHHQAIAEALEKVERGEILRLIITMPPRHGKSELASKRFPAWFAGKDPSRQVIFATYAQQFAEDFGREWREIMKMPTFQQVFPGVELKKDSQAANRMSLTQNGMSMGGLMVAVGVGGAITGRGADLLVIDDPLKNSEEADSAITRESQWNWYLSTAMTRLMPGGRIVIIMTRWHEDDIVGRILDPRNPHYDKDIAESFTVLNLPAVHDGKALWPERYPIARLDEIKKSMKANNFRFWNALYMQRPTPDDGAFFKRDWLVTYKPEELPRNLRYYGASDHAVSEKQQNDPNVIGCVGIDENDEVWVMPDVIWEHMETDRTVESLIQQMKRYRPQLWWMESELISKSFGPFLRRRMLEDKTFTTVVPVTPSKDKRTRARSIQGLMSLKRVHFPDFAPWWPDAVDQILKFPLGAHDDFVDWISWIGLGLDSEFRASTPRAVNDDFPKVGTIEWVKFAQRQDDRKRASLKAAGGF